MCETIRPSTKANIRLHWLCVNHTRTHDVAKVRFKFQEQTDTTVQINILHSMYAVCYIRKT